MTRILFVGLGNMGGPMAANLLGAGHQVTGVDLDEGALDKFAKRGGTPASSILDAVGSADVIITMLPAGKQVKAVYLGEEGILENCTDDAILVDSSTIDVDTSRELAQRAAERKLKIVDAPVSGGVVGAEAATLTFMVGGTQDAFNAAKPILEIMGKNIVHAGGAGNGQAAKVCNNMILGISMIAVCEGFLLAEKLGLDHQKLFDISAKSSGQCWSLTTNCPVPGPVPTSPANRDYKAGFSAEMMRKDLKLAQDAVSSTGAVTPLGAEASALYDLFCTHGKGGADFSGIINFLRGKTES